LRLPREQNFLENKSATFKRPGGAAGAKETSDVSDLAWNKQSHNFVTRARELELLAKREDLEARNELILSYRPFIRREASRFIAAKRLSITTDELVSVAIGDNKTGFIHAIHKFDPAKGCRLSTYALPWIKDALLTWYCAHVQHSAMARVPKGSSSYPHESIHEPLTNDDGDTWTREEVLADSYDHAETVEIESQSAALHEFISARLNEREEFIIRSRFLGRQRLSLRIVGARLGLCGERVRQIEVSALDKLNRLKQRPVVRNGAFDWPATRRWNTLSLDKPPERIGSGSSGYKLCRAKGECKSPLTTKQEEEFYRKRRCRLEPAPTDNVIPFRPWKKPSCPSFECSRRAA